MSSRLWLLLAFLCTLSAPASETLFQSDSKRFGNPKMDIVIAEVERRLRVSVLKIRIQAVGSSFFLLCSVRDLVRQRGNFRYVSKIEGNRRMLIGFLLHAGESTANLGQEFAEAGAAATEIDLEQFVKICDRMQ